MSNKCYLVCDFTSGEVVIVVVVPLKSPQVRYTPSLYNWWASSELS